MDKLDLHGIEQAACASDSTEAAMILNLVSEVRRLKHELDDPNYLYAGRIHRQAIVSRDARIEKLRTEVKRLQAFKDWVHKYLDDHGVPTHPPGPHTAEGCRIGDRLDWVLAQLERHEG